MLFSKDPTIYNKTLTVADQEYSQLLPAGTQKFTVQARTAVDIRYAWVTGKVAGPVVPYNTLKSGLNWWEDGLFLEDKTIYLASSTAGTVVEILVWT
jgi:hypothetical protein